MPLTLTMLRCPPDVAPETRQVAGGDFSIGRGPENNWVLPDPDKEISRRHCIIAFRNGGWCVAGTSANGTFLNRDEEPLESRAPRPLNNGDRLRLGAYEIEVTLNEDADSPAVRPGYGASASEGPGNPFDDDPFASSKGTGLSDFVPQVAIAPSSPVLPADFDPLAPDEEAGFPGPTQPDHSPAIADALNLPQPRAVLPADWNLDESATPKPSGEPPPPVTASSVRAAAPPPRPIATPTRVPVAVAPASEPPSQVSPLAQASAGAPAHADLLAAFLRGAEMPDAQLVDPVRSMEQLGAAFRAVASGLRTALIARAETKREFRIDATQILTNGNNPLKFSTNDDDALVALLGAGRRTDMTPAAAIAEALQDLSSHELAVMAAMQAAVRALVMRLSPQEALKAADAQAGSLGFLSNRKARAFEIHEALHAEILRSLSDDFDSVFGKHFARAYEQTSGELAPRQKVRR
ncbi:MAG: type VI secretion system-associated FHA domain protein TagH [Acetobacteraceae bacterium]